MPNNKSHVGMGVTVCPICLKEHDEVVLLDRRLKDSLSPKSFVGWGMCPEHQQMKNDGYIALIECSNKPTGLVDAQRTGELAHVRANLWSQLFNIPAPSHGLCFVEAGTIAKLQAATSQ